MSLTGADFVGSSRHNRVPDKAEASITQDGNSLATAGMNELRTRIQSLLRVIFLELLPCCLREILISVPHMTASTYHMLTFCRRQYRGKADISS